MPSDRARFQYTHSVGKETIRLVRILGHRETENGPLQLALEEHAITDPPAYRALSYTWGPPVSDESREDDVVTVLLEDHDFDVFSNLHDALLWIRARGSCDLYWIDAISINQADDVERGVQVSIMDHIYKLAVRVDIWLGTVTDEHRPAEVARLVHTMAANAGKESLYKPGNHVFDPGALRKYDLEDVPDAVWYAFVAFFDRKWFSRVWVVQEVALSKDAYVLWGDEMIPWETVALCTDFLFNSHLYEQLSEVLHDNNPTIKDVHVGGNSAGIVSIQRCGHDALAAWDSVTLDHIIGASGSGPGGRTIMTGGALLFLMLHLTIGVEASDPRDQVFGLLGILNLLLDTGGRPRTGLEPNYCKDSTAVKVYTETAVFIMEECGNLALLTAVADDADRQVKGLPSWVPDFSANGPSMFLGMRWPAGAPYFDACRSARAEYGVVDGKLLQVRGFCVGTVSLLGTVYSELAANGSFAQWADFLLQCDAVYKPTRKCRVEAFWRTLIVDRDGTKHPAPSDLRKAFRHWITNHVVWEVYCGLKKGADMTEYLGRLDSIRKLARSDVSKTVPSCDKIMAHAKQLQECDKKDQVDSMLNSFKHRCQVYINLAFETLWERRPFLTDSGHLGLGGRSMEEGDAVWVVAGCQSPLVLREVPVASISGPFSYRLVGEAYLHGIMHGEAVDDGVQWEDICIQ
ncbi:putative heterokaryon incompatibility protein [Colletotrichum sublineola]|uniref:Putative heterokaryon incompatibility protein n=1 Tax=Colletotrichum sublineola TaxID=1173701 RepID=A0A066X7I3_COLSU|nr:putative heterokaryon incompatibility protein [Colletotrichum sublineola]